MKLFVKLLCVFVATTLVGSACGNVESTGTAEGGGITSVATEGAVLPDFCKSRSSVYTEVTLKANKCAETGATISGSYRLWREQTLDGFRSFFTGYCDRKTIIRECLATRASEFKICRRSDDVQKSFNIYREILETVLEAGCSDGGEKLAIIWNGLKEIREHNTTAKDALELCIQLATSVLEISQVPNADISSFTFILHRVLHDLTACITKRINVDQPLKDAALFFSGEIIRKFKCIHPVQGVLVECDSVAPSLFALPSECHVITLNYKLDPYDELEAAAVRSILFDTFWYDLKMSIKNVIDYRRSFCDPQYSFPDAEINKLLYLSVTCLDYKQDKEFRALVDSLIDMKVPVCEDNSQAITDVMVAFLSRNKNFTDESNIAVACNDFAESNTQGVTSRNMRFYLVFKSFKECIVKKLEGDQNGVEVTTLLGNAMLKKVQCVPFEKDTTDAYFNMTVPCDTVVTDA